MKKGSILLFPILCLFLLTACGHAGDSQPEAVQAEINLASTQRLYVSAMFSDKIVVIDLEKGSVEAEKEVGETPYGVALDREGNQLLVACSVANEVWCLDLTTLETKAVIPVDKLPAYISVHEDQRKAYVGNSGSNTVSIIDLVSHQEIGRIPVGQAPVNLEQLPDNQLAVTLHEEGALAIVDLENREVLSTRAIAPKATGLAYDPGRQLIYAGGHGANEDNETIFIHPLAQEDDARQMAAPLMPISLALTPDGSKLLSLHHRLEQLFVFDTLTGERLGEINTGKLPFSIALWDQGRMAAVANMDSNEVQIVDLTELDTVKFIKVLEGPACMALLDLS